MAGVRLSRTGLRRARSPSARCRAQPRARGRASPDPGRRRNRQGPRRRFHGKSAEMALRRAGFGRLRARPRVGAEAHLSKVIGFTWTVEDVNLISENEIWGDVLVELAHADPRIVALSADLAHSTKLRRFKETFPERYFNVGIAEQNLVAVAAGLASMGLVPVA